MPGVNANPSTLAVVCMNKYTIIEVSEMTGLDQSMIFTFIQREWISPPHADYLDEQDVTRIQLIYDLQNDLGVNAEAVPVILHLVDQLYFLREQSTRDRNRE